MFWSFRHLIGWIVSALGSRKDLILENLALRQQLLALRAQRRRPRLSVRHKLFWVLLRRLWSGWKTPLLLVTPRTVMEWHRAGFRLYWNWLSRARQLGGRKPLSQEIRADLSYGCGEPHVGSTPHSRRVAEAGLPFIAANGLTLASTSPEKPRCGQALADVFTKSSRRHCGDGLLHGTHDHLWCPVLLLCYQP